MLLPCFPRRLPSCHAALTEGVLWGVDRATFRSLVVYSMAERRQRYEASLRGMPIFRHLSQQQPAAVADCLHHDVFEVGAPTEAGAGLCCWGVKCCCCCPGLH
jgi:hypothetical protein